MNFSSSSSNDLKTLVDVPDLSEAITHDESGTFAEGVVQYFSNSKTDIKTSLDAGVAPEDFEKLTRLNASIEVAERVVDFFVRVKKNKAFDSDKN